VENNRLILNFSIKAAAPLIASWSPKVMQTYAAFQCLITNPQFQNNPADPPFAPNLSLNPRAPTKPTPHSNA